MEGSWVSRAPSTPSGGLCQGKGQRKSPVRETPATSPQLRRGISVRMVGLLCLEHPSTLPGVSTDPQAWAYPRSALSQSSFSARELRQEREEKQPECPLLPRLRAEAGAGTALPHGQGDGAGRSPVEHNSPESGNAGAAGPDEDEGAPVHAAAFLLLLFFLPRRLLPAAQHPQLLQGQAQLWAQAGATSAESRGRRGAAWRWPPRAPPPALGTDVDRCVQHQGPGAWGWCPGVPAMVPGSGMGQRQRGAEALTATWPPPAPLGGGEGASRSSRGPGSAARPRSAPPRPR